MNHYTGRVIDNADPDAMGRLKLEIPALFGDGEEYPEWVAPAVALGTAPGAGWWWSPPVDSIVLVEQRSGAGLRWIGGEWGNVNTPPAFLAGSPLAPRTSRAGFTSPGGLHGIALDDETGLLLQVVDPADPNGIAHYIAIDGAAGEIKIGHLAGALLVMDGDSITLINAAGDTVQLHGDNGIMLAHHGGSEVVALEDGILKLYGTDIQIAGGAATVVGQGGIVLTDSLTGSSTTEPLILGTSLVTDLQAAITDLVTGLALVPYTATTAAAFATNLGTSLTAGAPYLSSVTETA